MSTLYSREEVERMKEKQETRLQVRLSAEDLHRLDQIAEFYGVNRSAVIRLLIRTEIRKHSGLDPPPAGAGTTTPPLGDQ